MDVKVGDEVGCRRQQKQRQTSVCADGWKEESFGNERGVVKERGKKVYK